MIAWVESDLRLRCDIENCTQAIATGCDTLAHALIVARRHGWWTEPRESKHPCTMHVCPTCIRKMN